MARRREAPGFSASWWWRSGRALLAFDVLPDDAEWRSAGGAGERISAEFERIRRELGDLPGVVASPARLRTMLQHLAKTLHPGVLNDCFYQAATAVCRKRAKALARPVPLHNMCLHCPNARRSAVVGVQVNAALARFP